MKVEHQGHNECMLATLAALAEVPLSEVRELACTVAEKKTWAEFCAAVISQGDVAVYWQVVNYLIRYYNLPLNLVNLESNNIYMGEGDFDRVPATGRGTILVALGGGSYHIMPWENGKVYDPNKAPYDGESLASYIQRQQNKDWDMSKFHIMAINVMEERSE